MQFFTLTTAFALIGASMARIPVFARPSPSTSNRTGASLPLITNVEFHRPIGKRAGTITSLDHALVTQAAISPRQVAYVDPDDRFAANDDEKPTVTVTVGSCSVAVVTQTVTSGTVTQQVTGYNQGQLSHTDDHVPAPTPVKGTIMNHLAGLPYQYQYCFHNEERAAARAASFHAKFTYPVADWCKGGWEANGGMSPAVWIERNIVPCVDFYFSGGDHFKQTPDRAKVRSWLEKVCGIKKYKLNKE